MASAFARRTPSDCAFGSDVDSSNESFAHAFPSLSPGCRTSDVVLVFLAPAHAESVVRYGISMADIPLTTGQPDRGAGAYQFTGYYDLRSADRVGNERRRPARQAGAGPRHRMEGRRRRQEEMALTLRRDVKFHDGSTFNADAVVWNLDKVLNDKAPQYDKRQSAQVRTRLPSVASWAKVDDYTVEITTKESTRSSPIRCSGS
jgi:peptide/nickel transport system substrate-binding protein